MDTSIVPHQHNCVFTVTRGVQTGARYLIPDGAKITVGSSIEHNIVLHDASGKNWSALLENHEGTLLLTALAGELQLPDEDLGAEQQVVVEPGMEFSAGIVAFRFTFDEYRPVQQATANDRKIRTAQMINDFAAKWGVGKLALRQALFAFSVCCVAVGTLSAIYAVTGSVIMVNATPGQDAVSFEDALGESGLSRVTYERARDGQSYQISGIVGTREDRHLILQMARKAGTSVNLDVQVNDELIEAVEDVYRVYGFDVTVQAVGRGHVKVIAASNNIRKLAQVEQTVKEDVPAVTTLEVLNNPPGSIEVPVTAAKTDPEKRVTLIAAGHNAYIMTQDQSRYFVGGMLPSGHIVKSIRDGEVIVSKNGKTETLKY